MNNKTIFQYCLAAIIVIGFFTYLIVLTQTTVPADNKDAINLVTGALVMAFSGVIGYFFGSSLGSAAKNDIIANQNKPT